MVFILQDVQGAYLRVDELVAELRKEKLRVFLSHFVEVLADLRIEADPQVVVNCELAVLLATYCHLPAI